MLTQTQTIEMLDAQVRCLLAQMPTANLYGLHTPGQQQDLHRAVRHYTMGYTDYSAQDRLASADL